MLRRFSSSYRQATTQCTSRTGHGTLMMVRERVGVHYPRLNSVSLRLRELSLTDNIRTIERGKMSVLSPEATPDKALRIFATLVRDQEVEGSNPFAPTTFLQTNQTVTATSC